MRRNLLYVALTRARDRLVLEWPGFLKERDEENPEAKCLFHVFDDGCKPIIAKDSVRIGEVICPALVQALPEQAGFTEYGEDAEPLALFGAADALPATPLTPARLLPSQIAPDTAAPPTETISLGVTLPPSSNDAIRGTALHMAMRTYLMRPDLAPALPNATGLAPETLTNVAHQAEALKRWLESEGYSDLRCEIPVLGHTPEGAEVSGMVDLLAIGAEGCLIVDHKSGGIGDGLGAYWPQLQAYAGLIPQIFPAHCVNGVAVFWLDHGRLELVNAFQLK